MNTRARALAWLRKHHGSTVGHIVTSKRYAPEESWTAEKAWWIQVPLAAIARGAPIHVLCEADKGSDEFRYLVIPAAFFEERLDEFALIGEATVNLFLAAEPGSEFVDRRGPGRVSSRASSVPCGGRPDAGRGASPLRARMSETAS